MDLESTLLALEEGFWRDAGDGRFHREHLAGDALMVLGPTGVLTREQVIAGASGADPWAAFHISGPRLLLLAAGAALLTYHATAHRGDGPSYAALVTSVYVNNGGVWQLAFHQHTPATQP